jgi:hypothetical protein
VGAVYPRDDCRGHEDMQVIHSPMIW